MTGAFDVLADAATRPLLRVMPRTNDDGTKAAIAHLNTPRRGDAARPATRARAPGKLRGAAA